MTIQRILTILIAFNLLNACTTNNSGDRLKSEIEELISNKRADIGISIIVTSSEDKVEINGNKLYPLLSTFKIPIALTILNRVEKGELSMKQKIFIRKEELLENTWSPFREKYPNGNVSISLEEAIHWMTSNSDNNITDILLRIVGGPSVVEKFIDDKDFVIKNNEEDMHKDWESQFINKATPNAFANLLKNFYDGKILNTKHTEWLYKSMVNSPTGSKRLKGKLPNIVIAQRAGTSFTNDKGVTGAINNVGIIELPNNQKIYIAVFVHNTTEEFGDGEEIIADIAKITWEYYSK